MAAGSRSVSFGLRRSDSMRGFVAWTVRNGRLLWLVALLLAIPATWRTVSLYQHLKSDLEELLPRESPSVRALDEMRARLPGMQYLGVVVDTGTPENLAAGERFIDDLAARIRSYPPEMVREVRVGNDLERRFVERHAPLYLDTADLGEILRRIEARRDYEVEKESGTLLDEDEAPPSLDLSDIEKKYDARLSDKKNESGRFSDGAQHLTLLFVEAGEFTTGADKARALLDRVKADAKSLGGPGAYASGMRMGFSSDVAISVEELDALEADLSVSSIIVVALEIAVIVLYFRWWRAIAVLFPPLLLATVYAFGLASLPPANVTDLNSNTAFLGSIIVGNGINVGIVLLARYREARRMGLGVDDALAIGVWGSRLGTLAAALAAAASYASLILTEFRGFRQFGFIGGTGLVASWVTAFVLIPPLVKWIDRDDALVLRAVSQRRGLGIMGRVVAVVERWPVAVVAVALGLTVASALAVSRFDVSTRLEHDFSKLRRVDTWETGDGYWGKRVDNLLGRYLTPTVVMTDSAEEASAATRTIRDQVDHGALGPLVASVRGVSDVLPSDQDAKIALAARIREALTPKIRSLVDESKRKKLDDLLGDEDLKPVTLADLPRSFLTGLRERDGTVGKTVLVYPRPSDQLWVAQVMHDFVGKLRATGGRVAGSIPLSDDIIASISRDAPIASIASFVGVVLIVLFVLRVRREVLYVVGSLVVGVLWLAGATMLLGVKVNFCNFVAFPITFGIGVDYSVNVMTRYEQDGRSDVTGAVRSTGAAVGLCSLTTIIGYSSLLLAKNRALYLFGLTAVLGEIACLTTAVVALPALLVAARNVRRGLAKRRGSVRDSAHDPALAPPLVPLDADRLRRLPGEGRDRDASASSTRAAPSRDG
ncbi:MAG TPA: MMPL family transporter [Polyangiaceae bacterium]|nr:MMPL family transporter [Polyangiaceae bacterium]